MAHLAFSRLSHCPYRRAKLFCRMGASAMTDVSQFSALIALWAVGFGLFAFMFQRLESRLEKRMDRLDTDIKDLRRDLAEEFRAQRAEVSAQVAAIAAEINASRG